MSREFIRIERRSNWCRPYYLSTNTHMYRVNSFVFSLDDFHVEQEIEKLPSNWFNDVCEFFSQLFA